MSLVYQGLDKPWSQPCRWFCGFMHTSLVASPRSQCHTCNLSLHPLVAFATVSDIVKHDITWLYGVNAFVLIDLEPPTSR